MNDDVKADCKECGNTEDPISLEEIKANLPNLFMFKQNNYCYCYLIDNIYTYVYGNNRNANAEPINVNNPLTRTPLSNAILEQIKVKYRQVHRLNEEVPVNRRGRRPVQRQVPVNRRGRRPVQIREPQEVFEQREEPIQEPQEQIGRDVIRQDRIRLISLVSRNPPEFYDHYEDENLRIAYEEAREHLIDGITARSVLTNFPDFQQNLIEMEPTRLIDIDTEGKVMYNRIKRNIIHNIIQAKEILHLNDARFDRENLIRARAQPLLALQTEIRDLLALHIEELDVEQIYSPEEYNRLDLDDLIHANSRLERRRNRELEEEWSDLD